MRVNITQEMINTHNHSAFNCPVAKAILAAFKDQFEEVAVTQSYVNLFPIGYSNYDDADTIPTISPPWPIQDWVARYDGHEKVVPFSFDLDIENNRITNIEGI